MNTYFDNAATTWVCEESIQAMEHVMRREFGNPSSLHGKGMMIEQKISEAKKFFAATLKVKDKEIYFTSGGTESNNLAIQGIARAYQRSGKHIITTTFEHPSVGSTMIQLQDEGFEITWIPVGDNGKMNAEDICAAIRPDTCLVSVMQVNNEIGQIQDIVDIGHQIKQKNPQCIFHVDGVQGYMKVNLDLKLAKVDLYSASSHKIYGPKGCGLLYMKQNLKIKPLFYGGTQQYAIRPGTENSPGIIGFYTAAKSLFPLILKNFDVVSQLKQHFVTSLETRLPEWKINAGSASEHRDQPNFSPYIISLRSKSIKGEVLLHALEDYKIYVSTGSACSSKKMNISHVLKSIGLNDEESDRSIRISLSHEHSIDDIDYLVDALVKIDAVFGKFTKK